MPSRPEVNDPHPLVSDYMARLRSSLAAHPSDRRDEIESGVRAHIEESLAELDGPISDAAVLNVLDRLGPPEEFVEDGETSARGANLWLPFLILGVLGIASALWSPIVAVTLGVVASLSTRAFVSNRRVVLAVGLVAIAAGICVWLVTGSGFGHWGGGASVT